ncbi:MAG: GNAT family N-acetyltransferase [Clostridium sp.]
MKIKKNIVYKDFETMYAIEEEYYNKELITPVEECFKWYKYRKESFFCIEDNSNIIGFMCLFPIRNSLYHEIKCGKYNDQNLKYTDILSFDEIKSGGAYNLFLSCVAISKEYKGSSALKLLLNSYKELYEQKTSNNIRFNKVIIDTATIDGETFANGLGFNFIVDSIHNTKIFEIEYDDLIKNIRN